MRVNVSHGPLQNPLMAPLYLIGNRNSGHSYTIGFVSFGWSDC